MYLRPRRTEASRQIIVITAGSGLPGGGGWVEGTFGGCVIGVIYTVYLSAVLCILFPLIHIPHKLNPWSACLGMFKAPDTQQYHYRKETKPPKTPGRETAAFGANGEFVSALDGSG